MKNIKKLSILLALLLALAICFSGCNDLLSGFDVNAGEQGGTSDVGANGTGNGNGSGNGTSDSGNGTSDSGNGTVSDASLDSIPAFSGKPYVAINGNVPFFTEDEITATSYEYYSELDTFGRCGVVHASLGVDTMPPKNDERGEISHVKPSGWVQGQYDKSLVDGGWLYNRAHLIGWQLSDEDDNEKNLITGTRYFNVEGMLPFENMVAAHLREDGGHVMYRVTPIYEGNNLVASGVLMEAYSVEDEGEGVTFCVYVYNVQPGIIIDYATGANCLDDGYSTPSGGTGSSEDSDDEIGEFVLNTSSKRIHRLSCSSVDKMAEKNKQSYVGNIADLLLVGYQKCGVCFN